MCNWKQYQKEKALTSAFIVAVVLLWLGIIAACSARAAIDPDLQLERCRGIWALAHHPRFGWDAGLTVHETRELTSPVVYEGNVLDYWSVFCRHLKRGDHE